MNKLTISDVIDAKLVEALRLVQCMLEDFRAQNYGHAHDWIRHIDSAMSEYTDTHTDDAYSMLHDLLQSGNSAQHVTVPSGYVLVPVETTTNQWAAGMQAFDSGMDKVTRVYKAMLAAAPKAPGSQLTLAPGWTGNSDANAALVMLDRIDTLDPADDDRIEEVKQIVRFLAEQKALDAPKAKNVIGPYQGTDGKEQDIITLAAKNGDSKCWCRICRPVTLTDTRFVVCPDCGNKRCPKANDHRNACSGSNEPGQEGSAYPDTPKGV
ncbi:hypothetical protein [Phytobacter sp. MRY16-398]|uniref:hypothetical protein n=1 Tax=Phytobacter sp. MRY16-398 TaxID=2487150 RepID=UPI000DF601AB|nr:hypothetical protein [Phytobacter sp. MRY16-398]BBE76233.1 hypothetical protein MRY16398_12890 [Phytobacter sp. MRY16-398]